MRNPILTFTVGVAGHYVQSPGGLGGECVDLANVYIIEQIGLPNQFLNAVDWQHVHLKGLTWVANGRDNFPSSGDIVVWNSYAPLGIGANGHIAVCVLADSNHLLSLDQNWPSGSTVTFVVHSYGGVAGWLHRA